MQIEPVIMDTSFTRMGVIDDYASFIWTTRYYTVGDFEICVDVTTKNKDMIKKGYYVLRDDDENVGIIEDITITFNEDLKEVMLVKGRFLSSILARRIIEKQTQINTTVSNAVYSLLLNEAISPANTKRKIPNLIYTMTSYTDRLDAQYTGKNLLEVIQGISETYHIGFKTLLDSNNRFAFSLYKGVDRSYNQSENPYVIFSDEYDNLLSSKYQEVYSETITDVLVAGEGEGTERRTLWVTRENKNGLDRYEHYQDQRNLSSNNGEISDTEYEMQLREEGLESITNYTTAFEGQVYFDNIEYRKDVFVGDICIIENTRWGIFINSRLVEVIESVSEDGSYTINPTFGV